MKKRKITGLAKIVRTSKKGSKVIVAAYLKGKELIDTFSEMACLYGKETLEIQPINEVEHFHHQLN
jgi:hypothetical protein